MLELDKIYYGNCADTMKELDDNSIDLTVTSPPYDSLRKYHGYTFDFEGIAQQLFRITKSGGVVVWVVGDATIDGSETGTSFRQALYFKEIGFNIETMVWEKTGSGCLGSNNFYGQNFEYMFIFCKGQPKTTNLICDRENQLKSGKVKVNGSLKSDKTQTTRIIERNPVGKRNNIWRIDTQKNSSHPAPFPEQLAADHILSWSNPDDLILDPMCGSGTTCKMAKYHQRHFLGYDISEEYCEIARRRVAAVPARLDRWAEAGI